MGLHYPFSSDQDRPATCCIAQEPRGSVEQSSESGPPSAVLHRASGRPRRHIWRTAGTNPSTDRTKRPRRRRVVLGPLPALSLGSQAICCCCKVVGGALWHGAGARAGPGRCRRRLARTSAYAAPAGSRLQEFEPSREQLVFLIDAGPGMLEPCDLRRRRPQAMAADATDEGQAGEVHPLGRGGAGGTVLLLPCCCLPFYMSCRSNPLASTPAPRGWSALASQPRRTPLPCIPPQGEARQNCSAATLFNLAVVCQP